MYEIFVIYSKYTKEPSMAFSSREEAEATLEAFGGDREIKAVPVKLSGPKQPNKPWEFSKWNPRGYYAGKGEADE